MGAMYRLKAYFGMVPADEMGGYGIEDAAATAAADRYPDRYSDVSRPERPGRAGAGADYGDERWDDRFTYDDEPEPLERIERFERERVERPRYDDNWDRRPPRPMAPERARPPGPSAVRGALAIDQEPPLRDALRPVPHPVPDQREPVGGAAAPARITTLQPRSYREARTIGEHYRAGQPVIMNLTELDAAEAKRLVDFAAGLVFALHGGFDKVTNRVFLLTPANVEVSADDARKLAERGIVRAD